MAPSSSAFIFLSKISLRSAHSRATDVWGIADKRWKEERNNMGNPPDNSTHGSYLMKKKKSKEKKNGYAASPLFTSSVCCYEMTITTLHIIK